MAIVSVYHALEGDHNTFVFLAHLVRRLAMNPSYRIIPPGK